MKPSSTVVSRETTDTRHGKRWSRKETDIARLNRLAGQDFASLAHQLGRTETGVEKKLRRLGIVIQPHRKPKRYAPLAIPARRRRGDREVGEAA